MNTWALQQTAASTVALFYCLQALMIALLAWLLLGEYLSPRVAVGGFLIMAGLFIVTWALDRKRKEEAHKREEQNELIALAHQEHAVITPSESMDNWITRTEMRISSSFDGSESLRKDIKPTEDGVTRKTADAYGTFV